MSVILGVMFDDAVPLPEVLACIQTVMEELDEGRRSLPINVKVQTVLPAPFFSDYSVAIRIFEDPEDTSSSSTLGVEACE